MNCKWNNILSAGIRKIGIPSPAGLPDAEEVKESCRILRSWGLEPVLGKHALEQRTETFFASDRAGRAEDLNAFIRDESIDLIWCTRGGYGSGQLLPLLDWNTLKRRNLPLIGYSDITAIHLGMLAQNAGRPIAAKMVSTLPEMLENPVQTQTFQTALERAWTKGEPNQQATLQPVNSAAEGKTVSGPLLAANLTLLASLCGSGFMPDLTGWILIVEDISSLPRYVDRDMTQLLLNGILQKAGAIVFGCFTGCGTEDEQMRLFRRFAEYSGTPCWSGFRFGHVLPSLAVPNGMPGTIQSSTLYF